MKRDNKDPVLRLVETLRLLPLERPVTTARVHESLAARGYEVSRRTVQRDLMRLAPLFCVDVDGDARRDGYVWTRRASLEAT